MTMLEHLIALAPQGETLLFVRQRPRHDAAGNIKFRDDGSIDATWPAMLPDAGKVMRTRAAWYGNTASYIIDRFEEGRPSASAANCEYVAIMILDDVGTKSKVAEIEPTWKMETSPGNFQWGYIFDPDKQPKKGEYSAAIKAIAAAGYTDPGAINPVRNFRLPGSVNLKPAANNFAARLVEFHPDRCFTLPQVCQALNVAPGEPSKEYQAIRGIKDDGTDDVLAWLVDKGLVTQNRNPEGWYGVICPNYAEHSDGSAAGRYSPATRAFMCFHGHCQDWTSVRFLEWVAQQGGPQREHGLREDLLAARMSATVDKLTPTEAFPNEAAEVVKKVEQQDLSRVEKSDWFRRYAYNPKDDTFFDLETRREYTRSAFNALYRHVPCISIHNGRRIEAAVCYDENRRDSGGRVIAGVTYAAGEGPLMEWNGEAYGNLWRNARPDLSEVEPANIDVWLAHLERMVPQPEEREHVLNVMAYKVQNPGRKINHAVLHVGRQGSGKDTLWAPMIWAVCGDGNINREIVNGDRLSSQWGYAYQSEILVLNELKETDGQLRRELANRLKPVIAAPPDTLTVNRKNLHPYESVNRLLVLAFSNDRMPITLESQDRRWFCLQSDAPRLTQEETDAIWRWYKAGGMARVGAFLNARDVSAFNPMATPMMTDFKLGLIEVGMSAAEAFVLDEIRSRRNEFAAGAVGAPFFRLCDQLQARAPAGVKIVPAALLHALEEAGWEDRGLCASAELNSRKRIFSAPDMARVSKSELRRMVETPAAPQLHIIKNPSPAPKPKTA